MNTSIQFVLPFFLAFLFLCLLVVRLRNIGDMRRLWPLLATVAAWLLLGVVELHVFLGHPRLIRIALAGTPVLLMLSVTSFDRV